MKRVLLHMAFWLVYLLQDAVLEMFWVQPVLKGISEQAQFGMALHAAIAACIPKLLLTYFIIYVTLPRLFKDNQRRWPVVLQATAAILATIVLYRVVFVYYINTLVYRNMLTARPLFHVTSVLLAVMDIGFVSGIAIALKLLRTQLATRLREKHLVKEKLEAELQFLRHQTNPHFLFNTLNNIYALARKKSEHTPEVVLRLSKLLRFMLYESRNDRITVSDELKILDDYLELEKMRYERLTVHFQKDIDNGAQTIAPLLLLPFVENAFKHGASESRFDSFIYMQVKLQQGMLTFNIENTREGDADGTIKDNIGLRNVRRQLELMYKDYDLQLHNQQHIFTVRLSINLNSYAKV
jgi:sensor histidine kinase YesM